MSCNYRLLQLTNSSVGAVATATFMPLGTVTRQIKQSTTCPDTFLVSTSGNDVVYVREPGFYMITYSGSLIATAAGNMTVNLQINGSTVYTTSVTVTAGGSIPINFSFVTRAYNNCCSNATNLPIQIQLLNSGVAITGGTSNLIIERVYLPE